MELKGIQWIIGARPTKMSEVYGGKSSIIDTVVKPFVKTHAASDDWPRGILLMGKSGGGKTTIAKIIAQTMVCKHLDENGEPCGECPDCRDIIEEKFVRDVQMITASDLKEGGEESVNSGLVKLISNSRARPYWGAKRRVIIFDEVQEVLRSRGAINELLKELERPEGRTCWIFTSMDEIKATGSTVETELGNGTGYGSSGQSGFLRRVAPATFRFKTLTVSDLMRFMFDFAHKHTYDGQLLWDYLKEKATPDFLTVGLQTIAEGSLGSVGVALANFQRCVDSNVFDIQTIEKFIGVSPEVKILDTVVALANNTKTDEAFLQLSGITVDNFPTVYQIMMSEIRRAEMVRVFKKLGNVKMKDGKEELKIIDESTTGPEQIAFNRASALVKGENYIKLRDTLIELNQSGFFTVDLFKVKLLSIFH